MNLQNGQNLEIRKEVHCSSTMAPQMKIHKVINLHDETEVMQLVFSKLHNPQPLDPLNCGGA